MTRHILALPTVTSGVYHLLRGGRVMYVGQSGNVLARIATWVGSMPGSFDDVEVFPCPVTDLGKLEEQHIREYDPPLNVIGRTRRYYEIRVASPPWFIEKYGSALAFLRQAHKRISGGMLMQRGLFGPGPTSHLLEIPGFPDPVSLRRHAKSILAEWDRDDVVAWWEANRADARAAERERA